MRDNRIKEYIFLEASGNNTGSTITQYTNHVINGELLRIDSYRNYIGSLIVRPSGMSLAWTNLTTTSGTTGKYESLSFTNTTGSFMVNTVMEVTVSGLASGTNTKFGPIILTYR